MILGSPPEINFNMLDREESQANLGAYIDTIKWAVRVFTSVDAPLGPIEPAEPPCDGVPDEDGRCDDETDRQWVTGQMFVHHETSTCAIGSVLDSEFRVIGIEGLRVVDASPFPRAPGAVPLLPTFMLREKAAESMLEKG